MKGEFVIRTKRPAQYLRAIIKNGYFPMDGENFWYIETLSFAGGGRRYGYDPLTVSDWKDKSRSSLIERLRKFSNSYRYIFSFNEKDF